jgi:putative transcriptional regulator
MPIVKRTAKEIPKSGGRVNWEKVRHTTDKEITAQIAPDTAPEIGDLREFRHVYNPPVPDVKAIRQKLGLSQAAFARRFGFSVRTVQQWEQGRAIPDRPARLLLKVIEHAPRTVERVLAG